MTAIAFAGSYADFRPVKTRSVVAITIEIPIEQGADFIAKFGMPIPGSEKPVAIALLNQPAPETERPRKSWLEMRRAQQAGILSNDPEFQDWCGATSADGAADFIRIECGVKSRADIDQSRPASEVFDKMVTSFRQKSGRMAEARR